MFYNSENRGNKMDNLKQKADQYLKMALNNPAATFRDGQWQAIESLVVRKRLLVVQRTGWGKSIVYFLGTRLLRDAGAGPTVVISPLLALIRNQLDAAYRLGLQAATINSDNSNEWTAVESGFVLDQIDLLLISPERLANERFRRRVLGPAMNKLGLGLFVVDEAHCISDWGHDFRPDYRRIARLLQTLPANVPTLATTATANNRVVADIQDQLGSQLQVIRGPLVRSSLRLQNITLPGKAERMAWLAQYLPQLPGSGIIYTLTVRDAKCLAGWLKEHDIAAEAYYGGKREGVSRMDLEQALQQNKLKALVATTALGMGFDKPDLGFVIHFQRPRSVVHYYQQVGRAGRAIDEAYGILLGGAEDKEINDFFIRSAFPPEGHTRIILAVLEQCDGLSIRAIERQVNLGYSQIAKALKLLSVESPSPVVKRGSTWHRTPVAYTPDLEKVTALSGIRAAEQGQMMAYLNSSTCLMQFLQRALDDPHASPCGRCAVCEQRALIPIDLDLKIVQRAIEFLRRDRIPIEPRKLWPAGDAFPVYGWTKRINAAIRPEAGYALCLWTDPGWGQLVRQGKQQYGRFADALVKGAAELIQAQWQPAPALTWVTCVPSPNNPQLVSGYAQRLARALQLPFQPCVRKIRTNAPQKEMQNSYQQAHNLDGAFEVQKWPGIHGPVLLVDDTVDSRWTLTVIAALLRQAGSGPVFPLVLAQVRKGM